MATKSILKNVSIQNKHLAKKFTSALSNAEDKSSKHVVLSKRLETVKSEDIKTFFGAE